MVHKIGCVLLVFIVLSCDRKDSNTEPATDGKRSESSATSRSASAVHYEISAEREREFAAKALDVLRNTCRFSEVDEDLQEVRVRIEDLNAGHYLTDRYGWRRVVRVEPKFREVGDISEKWAQRSVGGHQFDFRLGSGKEPGITADKWIGQELCGMEVTRDKTQFLAVPAMRVVDGIDVPDAAKATGPTPSSIDFPDLFQRDREAVRALFGTPGQDQYGEEQYVFPDMRISVRYQDGRAVRAELSSTTMDKAALMKFVDNAARKKFKFNEIDGVIYVMDPRIPETRPETMKILGAPKGEVEKMLGKQANLEGTWERDGYGIVVYYDESNVVNYLAITLYSGIIPQKRQADLRRWLGIPAGAKVSSRGVSYKVTFDDMSIVFEK